MSRVPRLGGALMRWETILVVLILAAGTWSWTLSSVFLTTANLLDVATPYAYLGLLAFGLTFVLLAGEIDISVVSTMAVAGVVFGQLSHGGADPLVAAPAALVVGTLLGVFNGLLVALLGLPSLAVTLGTLAAYRGLAFVLLGDRALTDFPHGFVSDLGAGYIGTQLPVSLIVLIICAVVLGVALHGTRFGRYLYAAGSSREAARFSGVPEHAIRVAVFGLAGLMAGVAALVYVGFFGSVQADAANGSELLYVVTVVVVGGVSIFGGSGTILGVALAFVLIAVVRNGMQLADIGGSTPDIVIGVLLLVAIMAGNGLQAIGARTRGGGGAQRHQADSEAVQEETPSVLLVANEVQLRSEEDANAKER